MMFFVQGYAASFSLVTKQKKRNISTLLYLAKGDILPDCFFNILYMMFLILNSSQTFIKTAASKKTDGKFNNTFIFAPFSCIVVEVLPLTLEPFVSRFADRQTDRLTDRPTDKQTDIQTDSKINRLTDQQTSQ